jgi:hypothetical protein
VIFGLFVLRIATCMECGIWHIAKKDNYERIA